VPAATRSKKQATEIASRYPRSVALKGGAKVDLRLMTPSDVDMVHKFAKALPANDLLFLRRNITDRAAVKHWADEIETGEAVTVLAMDGDTLAGYATVNLNRATWMRHLGEIRLLTATSHRGSGVGRALASEIYAVARGAGLRKLTAQMTLDQAGARATFERLGFKPEALLTDWVMDSNGRTRDLLVMAYDLEGLTDTIDA
jgi:L-amino acid N-acyltransferase YncA